MNELVQDLDPRYVPVKFDHNRRRIAPGRAVTGLAGQNNKCSLCIHLTSHISHEGTRPRSWPKVLPYQVWPRSEKNCTRESGNGFVSTDGQTDNLIPGYPPFNFVERGYKKKTNVHSYGWLRRKLMSGSWSFSWSWLLSLNWGLRLLCAPFHHLWSTGYALYSSRGTPSTNTKSSKSALVVTNRNLQLDLILLRALNPLSQLALAMGMAETSSYTAIIICKASILFVFLMFDRLSGGSTV